MSWSINAIGKADKVLEKVKTELNRIEYLTGAEATIKEAAAETILRAVAANTGAIKVNVSGSGDTINKTQSLNIEITPLSRDDGIWILDRNGKRLSLRIVCSYKLTSSIGFVE